MSEFDLITFKRNLRNKLIQLYMQKGYKHTKASIQELMKNSNKKAKASGKPELAIQIRGEACEILLEIEIWEYIRQRKLPWITAKGLCLNRTDHKRNKTTELDLTLFTPGKIILFESKYRKGDVILTDTCTIVPSWGNAVNVYKQNLMHLTNLKDRFANALITMNGVKPFAIVLYVESIKRVNDRRLTPDKKLVPLVGSENIGAYLKSIEAIKLKVWDMNIVRDIVRELDEQSSVNIIEHMKEVAR